MKSYDVGHMVSDIDVYDVGHMFSEVSHIFENMFQDTENWIHDGSLRTTPLKSSWKSPTACFCRCHGEPLD